MSIKYLLILCLLFCGTISADIKIDHPLTLSELVDIALENNPSTRSAWWNAHRAASVVGYAKSAYYPTVDVEALATNGRDFKFINGPDTNYTILGADLVLGMLLYDFGARNADYNGAKMALLATNWQSDWNIQKVMVKVLENAYATLHAQEIVEAARITLEEADKVLNAARELNRVGLTAVSDVYTAQATRSQMKMELTLQRALLDIQKGKLAASIGASAETKLEIASIEAIPEKQLERVDDLIALAMRQRADLMSKQARLCESVYRQKKARAGYGPKVSLYGRGGFNHAVNDKANAAQYKVMLNLEVPLFDGFGTMYQNRLAYADTQISTEELADLQLEISLEVLTYSRTLEAAQEMMPDAEEYLENAVKAYESVLEKYKAGKEGMAEVSIAQRQLAAARVRYGDVKTRWLVSIANLAYATGTLGSCMEEE